MDTARSGLIPRLNSEPPACRCSFLEEQEKMMKIEKGIEMPKRYPYDDMEVGDSFVVPDEVTRTSISASAYIYGKRYGKKFSVRKDATKVLRVWRIK
jgi:hypothetical protein